MREDAGFTDIKVGDDSANIRPMLRLFYALAVMMYFFIKLFGLERFFIDTVVGVQGIGTASIGAMWSSRRPSQSRGLRAQDEVMGLWAYMIWI